MSNQWIFYPCKIGEHSASIFYDHGIHESIDDVAPSCLLQVRIAFKHPSPDGLPTDEEFSQLTAFEDSLQALAQQHESLYVGRVTVDRYRYFYIYTPDSEDSWSSRFNALSQSHDYPIEIICKHDENHDGYWEHLFPSEDDWQVILDMRTIEALEQNGDVGTLPRSIDHWADFSSHDSAVQFSQWIQQNAYSPQGIDTENDGIFRVQFRHEGPVTLADITSHTIALRRKVSELGGEYDGWETTVCKPE